MKKVYIVAVLLVMAAQLQALSYNVFNVFSIDIPTEFDVRAIESSIRYNEKQQQYWLVANIAFIYHNLYLNLEIQIFGNGDRAAVAKRYGFADIRETYSNRYNSALNQAILKSAVARIPNKDFEISEFVSDWASGYSSDAIAYWFESQAPEPTVCIVGTINAWYSFEPKQKLGLPETHFWDKLKSEHGEMRDFYQLYRSMVEGIAAPRQESVAVDAAYCRRPNLPDTLYLPSAPNLALRDSDSKAGGVIGIADHRPYAIVQMGKAERIGGVDGVWWRVKTKFSSKVGWVFSGDLHAATKEELAQFIDE